MSFAKLLNEFVFHEELFPISFAKLLNEFVFQEELFPVSHAKLLNGLVSKCWKIHSVCLCCLRAIEKAKKGYLDLVIFAIPD